MIVSVLTCDRSPSYLSGTLASLRSTAPLVTECLFWDRWSRKIPPSQRLTLSFQRALLSARDDALIVEDDVEFRAEWPALLTESVAVARELHGPRFFLSLYSPHKFSGHRIARYDPSALHRFWGTQGQFVPAALTTELAAYLETHRARTTVDALIANWCGTENIPLLTCVPSLVQHVGRVSSLGDDFHSSPMFGAQ